MHGKQWTFYHASYKVIANLHFRMQWVIIIVSVVRGFRVRIVQQLLIVINQSLTKEV
jgi:hypothetical protein